MCGNRGDNFYIGLLSIGLLFIAHMSSLYVHIDYLVIEDTSGHLQFHIMSKSLTQEPSVFVPTWPLHGITKQHAMLENIIFVVLNMTVVYVISRALFRLTMRWLGVPFD